MYDPHAIYKICFSMVKQAVNEFFSDEEEERIAAEDYIFDEDSTILHEGTLVPNFFSFENCCYFLTKYPQFSGKEYKAEEDPPIFNPFTIREKLTKVKNMHRTTIETNDIVSSVLVYQMSFTDLFNGEEKNV